MNVEQLKNLAQDAKAFARTYATVKEALVAEGVKETEAVEVARRAAEFASVVPEEWSHESDCPLCGGGLPGS